MTATSTDPKSKSHDLLRYLGAYAWYVFFIALCVAIIFGLRSDIYVLCFVFSVPENITHFIYTWGTYPLFLPFIGVVAGLEPYMNQAAQKHQVLKRALKVLMVEGIIGLVVLLGMGILALMGYPPTL